MKLRLIDVITALGGTLSSEGAAASVPSLSAVGIDSRNVQPGSLFIALPGENTDGHRFVGHAFSRGAAAAPAAVPHGPSMCAASLGAVALTVL